jgi:hypothetical protein
MTMICYHHRFSSILLLTSSCCLIVIQLLFIQCNAFSTKSQFKLTPITRSPGKFTRFYHPIDDNKDDLNDSDRRVFLSSIVTNGGIVLSSSFCSILQNPSPALALEERNNIDERKATTADTTTKPPNFTQEEIASFLHPIPTYTIVDKTGVPYMVVGEDAKLSAYFFTTYEEANRILNIASKSVDKNISKEIQNENLKRKQQKLKPLTKDEIEDSIGINPWKEGQARISTVPLDFSVSLASRGKVAGSFFRIAPAEDDIKDALDIETTISDLAEGKVPLFYIDEFELSKDGSHDESRIPLYFQKSQLLKEYNRSKEGNDDKNEPVIKVTELFSVLSQMAGSNEFDEDLKKLVIVPPYGSERNVKLCEKKGEREKPYKIGERIVVL